VASLWAEIENIGIAGRDILKDINLNLGSRGIAGIFGETGSGKTTLLRTIAGIIPSVYNKFQVTGHIEINGLPPVQAVRKGFVAFVPQNINSFFIGRKVAEELYLSKATPLTELLPYTLYHREISTLSAGEKYRLLVAVALGRNNRGLLLFDEPSSYIDPWSLEEFLNVLRQYLSSSNASALIADHKREIVGRVSGTKIVLGSNRVCSQVKELELGEKSGDSRLRLKNVFVKYGDNIVLKGLELMVASGESVAILGRNGAGKTTLLKCIANPKECHGDIDVEGKVFYIPEHPIYWFSEETVFSELNKDTLFRPGGRSVDILAREILGEKKLETNPYNLSVGEARLLSFLKALKSGKEIILFDEPTLGLDYCRKKQLLRMIAEFTRSGGIFISATHDLEFASMLEKRYRIVEGVLERN
jgi:ABC-type multidrug transport system ATPase subunit